MNGHQVGLAGLPIDVRHRLGSLLHNFILLVHGLSRALAAATRAITIVGFGILLIQQVDV